ncbi:hypothetical protein BDZ91DRAFT_187872 [Kalaharituber pfeilii]|nr:hypothetical protein BDZ91DRAFT_187872 [Kalaharituber pfeilii]
MVSWSTAQSLILFFGPILYHLLNLLFLSSFIALLSTLPLFHPENIIRKTSSRLLQTSTDVVFNRLHSLRPPIPTDDLLRKRLTSKDGRLLYALYGPGPLTSCTWCRVDHPETFLYYSLPRILMPHLLHVILLGIVTSSAFGASLNKPARIWRTQATLAGIALAIAETWYIATYNHRDNILSRTTSDAVFPHWNLYVYRGLAIASVDGLLGYAIYLTGTGRWGNLIEDLPDEKLEEVSSMLEKSMGVINSATCMKHAAMRDPQLRAQAVRFWEIEALTGKELMEDEDVRAAIRKLESRSDWVKTKGDAKKRARMIARSLYLARSPMSAGEQQQQQQHQDFDTSTPNTPRHPRTRFGVEGNGPFSSPPSTPGNTIRSQWGSSPASTPHARRRFSRSFEDDWEEYGGASQDELKCEGLQSVPGSAQSSFTES